MVARKRAKVKRKKVAIKKTKPAKKAAKKVSSSKKKARKKTASKSRPAKAVKKKKSKVSNTSIKPGKKAGKKAGAKKKAVSTRHVRAAKKRWRDQRKREKQIKANISAAVDRQLGAHPELAGVVEAFKQQLDAETQKAFKAGIRKGRKETIEKERAKGRSQAYLDARQEMEDARKAFFERMRKQEAELMADFIETDESEMLARMILANEYGELDQEVETLAEEYDWDIRDVYDLFFDTP